MRKLILYIASSLDGFIAGEDNDIGWLFTDDEYGYAEFIETVDTILMGRKTYDLVKSRKKWPYPDKKCYVFTKESNPNPDKRVMFTAEPV
ncbi:MAG: dihydrofolate reductase family protein, partial [Bacteroidota bacterium]